MAENIGSVIPVDFEEGVVDTVVEEEAYNELIPPEDKPKEVGIKVWNFVEANLTYKEDKGLHNKWVRNYELGRGKHWRQKSDKVQLATGNLLFTHRERTVNHLTDRNPTFNIRAVGEMQDEDVTKLEVWDYATQHWWGETEQQAVLSDSVYNGETYGSTIEWRRFNPELEMNRGEIECLVVDPFYFGTYPVRERDNQKAMANLVYMPIHLQDAKRLWPEHADKLRTDGEIIKEMGDERHEIASGSGSKARSISIGGIVSRLFGLGKDSSDEMDENCLIVFCYVKDYTMIKAQYQDDPDNEYSEPKYPGHIRHIIVANQGQLVLEDVPNPSINPNLPEEEQKKTYLYDKFPITRVNSLYETTLPYGPSDFEQLEVLNIELNKSLSQFNNSRDKAAEKKVINPRTSGVPNSHFTNYQGMLNPRTPNHGISYLEAQPMNSESLVSVDLYKMLFFLISGTFELDQAGSPGKNVIAHKAIAALLERQSRMMNGKDRNYGKLVRERGRMYISHAMNFYTEERWVSYEEEGEDKAMSLKGTEMIIPIKLMVVSGSTMPVSKIQEREEAIALRKLGVIDNEACLEAMDFHGRRNIIKRMNLGPIGQYLERLKAIMPPQLLQMLGEIAKMDDKDFARAVKENEIQPIQLPDQPPNPAQIEQQANMMKIKMELQTAESEMEIKTAEAKMKIQKETEETHLIAAKKALVVEQITTERVKQQVALEGIDNDKEMLKLERAKVIEEMKGNEADIKGSVIDRANKTVEIGLKHHKDMAQGGSYNERGMKSNNLDVLE